MTIKEFLSLSRPDQAIEAANVLVDKPWKHKFKSIGHGLIECHCGASKFQGKRTGDESCSVPDPIDIDDWNVAKKYQMECEDASQLGQSRIWFDNALMGVKMSLGVDSDSPFAYWRSWETLPIHILTAAMDYKKPFNKETE